MDGNRQLYFRDVSNPPPCGYVYETHGERVASRTYVGIEPAVRRLMAKYGIQGLPESEIAAFMCPHLDDPARYCRGPITVEQHTNAHDAYANSVDYCTREVVTFDRIARRERICAECPKHRREWCPTCTGHPDRLAEIMGGRRPRLNEDRMSGVCECAKAYEFAIASVEYGKDERIWEGAPETCWRFRDV